MFSGKVLSLECLLGFPVDKYMIVCSGAVTPTPVNGLALVVAVLVPPVAKL